jgi:hypothetical protein
MTSYSDAIRGNDVADFCVLIIRKSERAIAYGTGLGGPDGPEPVKPSPPSAPSHIAKENNCGD